MIDTPRLAKSEYLSSLVFHTASRTVWNTNDDKYSNFDQIGASIIVSMPHCPTGSVEYYNDDRYSTFSQIGVFIIVSIPHCQLESVEY